MAVLRTTIRQPLLPQVLQRRLKPLTYKTVEEVTTPIRSVSTMSGLDHHCIYVPFFDFSALLRFELGDHPATNRWPITGTERFTFYAELNPEANDC